MFMLETIVKKIENEKDFFLSIKKVALILSVSNQTVINLIKKKNIKYIKVGKLYKIPKQSLIEYITNNLY
ncbi:helix-turn-helix domain-containing protein [Fusobacterium nucleatum]|uniref:helix-turn-helix domain-containing protein n=2 Tax=Fusobacterium nucleatum TaxID=851 RepID=UPI00123BF2AD|nr:helix-turn-helix domain-containing protein [Fusobacterium nucleatum]